MPKNCYYTNCDYDSLQNKKNIPAKEGMIHEFFITLRNEKIPADINGNDGPLLVSRH